MALRRTCKSIFCSSSQVATKTMTLTTILKRKSMLTTKSICDTKTSLKTKTILTTKSSVIQRLRWRWRCFCQRSLFVILRLFFWQSWQRSLSVIRRLPKRWSRSCQRSLFVIWRLPKRWSVLVNEVYLWYEDFPEDEDGLEDKDCIEEEGYFDDENCLCKDVHWFLCNWATVNATI